MDEFDSKRKMVKVLLDTLKKSAGDEMSKGIPVDGGKPAPMPPKGVEQTKLPQSHPSAGQGISPDMHKAEMGGEREKLAPVEMDHPHRKESFEAGAVDQMNKGGMVDLTKDQSLMEPTSDDMHMSDGGMASPSDEPERVLEEPEHADSDQSELALSVLPKGPAEDDRDEEQDAKNSWLQEEDEDSNQSAFNAFFPRKKKK